MFCPFCGIKNKVEQQSCFVCSKKLPSLDSEPPVPRARTLSTPRTKAVTSSARLRYRVLALLLDLLFVAAVVFVSSAALWSQIGAVRKVSAPAITGAIAGAGVLLILVYTWLSEVTFGATIGKAFAGVRVIPREDPLSPGARAGVIGVWMIAIAAAVWGALAICPQCFSR